MIALTSQNVLTYLVTGLTVGGIYSLSSLGLVVVHRATGILNFAQGAVGAVAALTCSQEIIAEGRSQYLGYALAILIAVALSLFYGRVLAPRLAHRDPVVKAVGTLGFALCILGFCGWRWTARVMSLRLPTDSTKFDVFDVTVTLTRALVIVFAVAVTIGITLLLDRTRVGLAMRSLANDRELSSMIGIDVQRAETVAWIIGGVLSGVSGLLFANVVRLDAASLTFLVIPAIAAAVVGQLRSLWLTFAGAMIIGVVEAEFTNFTSLSPYKSLTQLIVGASVVIVMQRSKTVSFVGADS